MAANSVGTQNENIYARALNYSLFASEVFHDLIRNAIFSDVMKAPATPEPVFATQAPPAPPAMPDAFAAHAIAQLVRRASEAFIGEFFGAEPEVDAARNAARAWLAAASEDGADLPEGGYLGDLLRDFTGGEDAHPDYLPQSVAERLDDHVRATYQYAKDATMAEVRADLRLFALGATVWQDRSSALRAAADYVVAESEAELEAAGNEQRIQSTRAAMESGMAKWIQAQIDNHIPTAARIATEETRLREQIDESQALFNEIELRTAAARTGAKTLAGVVAAARSAINGVVSQTHYGAA